MGAGILFLYWGEGFRRDVTFSGRTGRLSLSTAVCVVLDLERNDPIRSVNVLISHSQHRSKGR